MTDLLPSELLKLRTLRSTWAAVAAGLVLSAVIGVAQVRIALSDATAGPVDPAGVARAPAQVLWFFAVVLALLVAAGEFQYRTIRTTVLVAPRRGRVLAAKCVAASFVGAGLVAGGAVVATVAAWVTAGASGSHLASSQATDWAHVVAAVAVGSLWAVIAVGLGTITRSIAIAIAALLLWQFVGEGLLPVITRMPDLAHWTPNGAAAALTGSGGAEAIDSGVAVPLLAAYVGVVVAVAVVSFTRTQRL